MFYFMLIFLFDYGHKLLMDSLCFSVNIYVCMFCIVFTCFSPRPAYKFLTLLLNSLNKVFTYLLFYQFNLPNEIHIDKKTGQLQT